MHQECFLSKKKQTAEVTCWMKFIIIEEIFGKKCSLESASGSIIIKKTKMKKERKQFEKKLRK